MKSKIFFIIAFISLTLFSACEKMSPNEQSSHRDFAAYSMGSFASNIIFLILLNLSTSISPWLPIKR